MPMRWRRTGGARAPRRCSPRMPASCRACWARSGPT
jgi:hypothetical protein